MQSNDECLLQSDLWCYILRSFQCFYLGGTVRMIEKRTHSIKAHCTKKLLVEVLIFFVLENGVPLVRDLAESVVDGHCTEWRFGG